MMSSEYAVIFDMDGTVLDSERVAQKAWQQAAREQNYILDDALFLRIVGCGARESKEVLEEELGKDFPLDKVRKRKVALVEEHIQVVGIDVKDGLRELVQFLRSQRVRYALATSTLRQEAIRRLEGGGVLADFPVMLAGEDVENTKPAPDIFLKAARLLGTEPEKCFVLEDSDNGVLAADRAGMMPIIIPDLKPPSIRSCELAHRIFPSLREVKDYFCSL